MYSVGKIPGGFIKREKPSEKAILTARAIDRPIRPLFPNDLRNDVVVVNTVLSVEQDNSPEITAMIEHRWHCPFGHSFQWTSRSGVDWSCQ